MKLPRSAFLLAALPPTLLLASCTPSSIPPTPSPSSSDIDYVYVSPKAVPLSYATSLEKKAYAFTKKSLAKGKVLSKKTVNGACILNYYKVPTVAFTTCKNLDKEFSPTPVYTPVGGSKPSNSFEAAWLAASSLTSDPEFYNFLGTSDLGSVIIKKVNWPMTLKSVTPMLIEVGENPNAQRTKANGFVSCTMLVGQKDPDWQKAGLLVIISQSSCDQGMPGALVS